MFDGASNVQLGGILLKVHYPKLTFMRDVEHTVSLFFNDVSKIPIVNQMIYSHKIIYNIIGYGTECLENIDARILAARRHHTLSI